MTARADFGDEKLRACHIRALPNGIAREDKWVDLKEQIKVQFKTFVDKKDLYKRPYAALVTATIVAHLGHFETAIAQLENWIQAPQDGGRETTWFRIRAQLILIHLTDYWIRREGSNASIVLRDYYLARVDKVLGLIDELFNMRAIMWQWRHGMTLDASVKARFSSPPPQTTKCEEKTINESPLDDKVRLLGKLYYTYLVMYAYSAHYRLLHPEYSRHHAPHVHRALTDLWETSLACVVFGQGDNRIAHYTWLLRLIATMYLQDALAARGSATRAAIDEKLETGLNAANLGLRLVRSTAESQLREKRGETGPLLQRLAPTGEIAELEQLLRIRAELLNARDNLD